MKKPAISSIAAATLALAVLSGCANMSETQQGTAKGAGIGAVAGALQTIPYNSEFVELDPDGNFRLDSALTNASGATPQANCGDSIDNRPVLLVRTVTAANAGTGAPAAPGAWFAAGVLKNAQHRDDDNGRDNRGR